MTQPTEQCEVDDVRNFCKEPEWNEANGILVIAPQPRPPPSDALPSGLAEFLARRILMVELKRPHYSSLTPHRGWTALESVFRLWYCATVKPRSNASEHCCHVY
jgi:hypothetical protein